MKAKKLLSIIISALMVLTVIPQTMISFSAAVTDSGEALTEFNGHSYQLFKNKDKETAKTWEDALDYCRALGGYLAVISSKEENDFLYNYIKSCNTNGAYFGLSDSENEGTWKWCEEEASDYLNWNLYEPNSENSNEDYASFYYKFTGGTWNDGDFGGRTINDNAAFICEWNNDNPYTRKFPAGYDFYEDSYNFCNPTNQFISSRYFTTMFEEASGMQLYKKKKWASMGGLCYGMAYTTASIYNGLPDCSKISTYDQVTNEFRFCNNIREIINIDFSLLPDIHSALTIGDNTINVEDFIKYSFIYQWSFTSQNLDYVNINDLYNIVKNYTDDNRIGVIIGITHYKKDSNGEWNSDSGHEVLAIGYEGNDILIDDPNNTNGYERIEIEPDGGWKYSGSWDKDGVNNSNSRLDYQLDYDKPYNVLKTGEKAESYIDENGNAKTNGIYLEGMEKVNANSTLICIDTKDDITMPSNAYEIRNTKNSTFEESSAVNKKLYWLENDTDFTLSDFNGDFSMAGDNTILSVSGNNIKDLNGNIDQYSTGLNFRADEGEAFSATYSFVEKDTEVSLTVDSAGEKSPVSIKETTDGAIIEGISNGTLTLKEDDTVIATKEITDAKSDVLVTYDKKGENQDVKLDYTHEEEKGSIHSVSVGDIKLNYKKSTTLSPSVSADEGVKYKVEYSSSDNKVATVDKNGRVYGAHKGNAVITCTVTDEYGNVVKDTANVKINYNFGQWLIVILLFGWIWY